VLTDFLSQWRWKPLNWTITVSRVIFALWFLHCKPTIWSSSCFFIKNIFIIITICLFFFPAAAPRLSHSGRQGPLPGWCTKIIAYLFLSSFSHQPKSYCPPKFPTFSLDDLERVKDTDKWLSDTHVAFSLMFGPFFFCSVSTLIKHRDSFRDCAQRNIWGNLKIQMLDTPFWSQLTEDPDRFGERFRTRVNLLEHDFVVMPMFEG
jgi:hypothetical protein